ncbi:MAG: NAD-dependent epimerase/dehydratase family protein [Terriglobales bacterium]
MKRALVTGGAGFVGANIVRRLLADGCETHCILRKATDSWRLKDIDAQIQTHRADLKDDEIVPEIVKRVRPDLIFHLAAYGAYTWQTQNDLFRAVNVESTVNLLNACQEVGFEAFINAGTSSEYGGKDHAPDEEEETLPETMYAKTKLKGTQECTRIAREHNLPVVTLRLYSCYGAYEEPRRLMPTLIMRGLEHKLPPLVNPDVAHDFVYIDDVCDAFMLAAKEAKRLPGAVYNVGSGIQTKMQDVVSIARQLMGIEAEPHWGSMENRQFDSHVWVANITRIRADLGWVPRTNLRDGLARTIEWFQSNPDMRDHYQRATQTSGAAPAASD